MAKIWFRVGMEAEISDEMLNLMTKDSSKISDEMMLDIIKDATLSGETYIVGKCYGGVDDYDNPDKEITFLF